MTLRRSILLPVIILAIIVGVTIPALIFLYEPLTSMGTTAWTTYSGKGISFEYPSSWTIEEGFANGDYVSATSGNGENGIKFSLPYPPTQTMYQNYPSLEAFANDIIPKIGTSTVEEGFTEKYFNGFPGVVGKLSFIDSMSYFAIFHKYDNQLYLFQYFDNENNFDSNEGQETMFKVISSFKFI